MFRVVLGAAIACACACASSPAAVHPAPTAPVASAASSSPASSPASLLTPASPDELRKLLAAPGAKATLVNVWATWCEPCVKEFPDVLRAGRDAKARGVRTMFVSADFESERSNAEAFLAKQGVDFTSYVKTGDDQAFIDALSKSWSGSIPATMIYDAQGNLRFFREGEIDYAGVTAALDSVLE